MLSPGDEIVTERGEGAPDDRRSGGSRSVGYVGIQIVDGLFYLFLGLPRLVLAGIQDDTHLVLDLFGKVLRAATGV